MLVKKNFELKIVKKCGDDLKLENKKKRVCIKISRENSNVPQCPVIKGMCMCYFI